ncbi:hypothetical protein DFH09DRAFT_1291578 [Mycena vulgaris]|nr:hypothetical protein DFH09DRAFT_1291578 [Mycena vulgaris]
MSARIYPSAIPRDTDPHTQPSLRPTAACLPLRIQELATHRAPPRPRRRQHQAKLHTSAGRVLFLGAIVHGALWISNHITAALIRRLMRTFPFHLRPILSRALLSSHLSPTLLSFLPDPHSPAAGPQRSIECRLPKLARSPTPYPSITNPCPQVWDLPILTQQKEGSGVVTLGCLCIIVFSSLAPLRRQCYSAFLVIQLVFFSVLGRGEGRVGDSSPTLYSLFLPSCIRIADSPFSFLTFPAFFTTICYRTTYAMPWLLPHLPYLLIFLPPRAETPSSPIELSVVPHSFPPRYSSPASDGPYLRVPILLSSFTPSLAPSIPTHLPSSLFSPSFPQSSRYLTLTHSPVDPHPFGLTRRPAPPSPRAHRRPHVMYLPGELCDLSEHFPYSPTRRLGSNGAPLGMLLAARARGNWSALHNLALALTPQYYDDQLSFEADAKVADGTHAAEHNGAALAGGADTLPERDAHLILERPYGRLALRPTGYEMLCSSPMAVARCSLSGCSTNRRCGFDWRLYKLPGVLVY